MTRSGTETEWTVGAVARNLGVPVATLRSWHQRYELTPRPHRPGEHRLYTAGDVAVLRRMVDLVRAGIGPRHAAAAARTAAPARPAPGNTAPMMAAAARLDTTELLDLLTAHISHFGVTATWNRLCRPAFAELIERQRRGQGLIEVEHALSGAIATALHRAVPPVRTTGRLLPVLLACAGGECHTLPLEVLRAALAEDGIPAVLLGASVPGGALAGAHRYPVVVLWSQVPRTASTPPLPAGSRMPGLLLLAGPGWTARTTPGGARRVGTLEEAIHLIGRTPDRNHH
ncbi:MerR family transcriptional regulator [Nocardia sp. NPDC004568]|uniref:MerR family transcriptional regulator n=1 Tax=Nocardia sp. NPDC004568 TaxID=3154551 RepID=UPI0033A2DFFE